MEAISLGWRDNRAVAWVAATLVMLLALLWPALWNGFPLVFYDTGGYLVRVFEHELGFGRSGIYGAFLWPGIPFKFWPVIVAQAALVAWLVTLTLRAHGFGGRPALAASVVVGLGAITGLPWFAAMLIPDIFLLAAVLGIYLLAFHQAALRAWEQLALAGAVAFALASHMSTLGVALGLLVALALLAPFAARIAVPRPALLAPAAAIMLGLLLAPVSNLVIAGRFAFTPGGGNFAFIRLIDDGILKRFLAEHCPDETLRICAYRDDVPATGNDWLWGDAPLWTELGGPIAFEDEARRIVLKTLVLYPGDHLSSALRGIASQLFLVRSMDHFKSDTWHTTWAIETHAPRALASYLASRQHQDALGLQWLDSMYVPVAIATFLALPFIVILGWVGRVPPSAAALALVAFMALVGNAMICGTLSVPADRYQSRLAPLATLSVMLAALGWRRRTRRENAALISSRSNA
jgi:hypothetical protein